MENHELIITLKKLTDNMKRYFWVLLITLVVGIGIILFLENDADMQADQKYVIEKVFAVQKSESFSGEETESSNILSDIVLMSGTAEFVSAIENKMEEAGFSGYTFIMDNNISRSVSGNVVIFRFEADNKKEVETLSEVYCEHMLYNMNRFLDDKEIVLNSGLSETTAREVETGSQDNSIISVKNTFIIFLSLLSGMIAVFILTVLDKFVRNKNEISGLEDSVVLGTVKKKKEGKESFLKTAYCINQYVYRNNIQKIDFFSFSEEKKTQSEIGELLKVCAEVLGEDIKINYHKNIIKNYRKINQMVDTCHIIFLCIDTDKNPDVTEGLRLLGIAGITPEAIIYID